MGGGTRRILGAALILGAFGMGMLHVQDNLSMNRMERDGRSTEGRILELSEGRLADGTTGHAALVEYTANGATYRALERVDADFASRHATGDTLTLRYWSEDPRLIDLTSAGPPFWRQYALYLAIGLFGIGLVLSIPRGRRR